MKQKANPHMELKICAIFFEFCFNVILITIVMSFNFLYDITEMLLWHFRDLINILFEITHFVLFTLNFECRIKFVLCP